MPTYATPGVYFESVDQAAQGITAIRTDIAAFIGIAERGAIDQPTPVNSWAQFQSAFGNFLPNGYLAYAAKAFFENGGQTLYGVRVAAPGAGTNTSIAPPVQPADGLSSVVDALAGFVPGAIVTISQTITANATGPQAADRLTSVLNIADGFIPGAAVLVTQPLPAPVQFWHRVSAADTTSKTVYWETPLESQFVLAQPIQFKVFPRRNSRLQDVVPGARSLVWETSLLPEFNVSQPIQFDTGAGTATGVFYDDAGNASLRIDASSPGAWGNRVAVNVGNTNLAATTTSALTQPASGTASYVESIVGFPRYSVVRIYQMHLPSPIIDYRTVKDIDPVTNAIKWDSPLTPTFDVTKPMSFETMEFSLTVYYDGNPKESFGGLSLNPSHSRYVEKVVNPAASAGAGKRTVGAPSQYIRVHDLFAPDAPPDNFPLVENPSLRLGILTLAGGRDGIAGLRPADFTGDPGSELKRGLRTLEDVDEISILAAPDILIEPVPPVAHAPVTPKPIDPCLPGVQPPQSLPPEEPQPVEMPPRFALDEISRVQQALIAHCESMRFRFAILDSPDFGYPNLHVDLGEVQSWRQRFDTEFSALYYPWVLVNDPLMSSNQPVRRVPPSGHVAGVYAHTDLIEGVFKAPANTALLWAQALTTDVSANQQSFLNPAAIDCLRVFPGRGIRVYGARTLSSEPAWRFVNVRRLISMIEKALLISLQWCVFEPNNQHLWNQIKASASGFLEILWSRGALAGNTAEEAFYVKCDATNNPLATTSNGQLNIEIGVAPSLPAEFIVFRIGRAEDTLEVSE